jgi:CHAT domain-containing protein
MKQFLIFLILCVLSFNISAQEIPKNPNAYDLDSNKTGAWTIFYDKDWNITEVIDSVEFYRIITYENGLPKGKVTDFYLNGIKQWEGKLILNDSYEINDDTCIWYNINSSIKIIRNYKNGNLQGVSTYNDSIGSTFLSIKYSNSDFKELVYCQLNKANFTQILEVVNNDDYKNSISICNAILDSDKSFFIYNPIFKSILLNIMSEKYYFLADYVSAKKYQLLSFNILSENMKIESGLYIDNLFGVHSLKSPYVDSSFVYKSNYLRHELDTIQDVNKFLVLYNNIASNYMHSERYLNEYFGYDNNLELKEILNKNSIFILRDLDSIILEGKKNNKLLEISHLQRVSMYYGLFGDPSSINFAIKAYDLVKSEYNPSDFSFIVSELYLGKAYMYNYYYDDAAIYFNSVAEKLINNIDIYNSTLPNHLIDEIYNVALDVFNSLIFCDIYNAYCYDLYSFINFREFRKIKVKNRYSHNTDINLRLLSDSLVGVYKDIAKCYELSNKQQKKYGLDLDELIANSRILETKINKYTSNFKINNYNIDDITSRLKKDEVFVDLIMIDVDFNSIHPQIKPHYFAYVFWSDSLDYHWSDTSNNNCSNYFTYYKNSDTLELNPLRGNDSWLMQLDFGFNLDSIYNIYNIYAKERPSDNTFNNMDQYYGTVLYNGFWYKIIDLLYADEDDDRDMVGDISTVYFSPEGVYSKINPNVLFDSISSSFIIDKYDIVYVSSIEDFVHQKENIQLYEKPDDLYAVLIGNPTFLLEEDEVVLASNGPQSRSINQDKLDSLQRGMLLSDLPGTQTEIDLISNNLKSKGWDVEVVSGVDATETRIKSIEAPKILHIATHGFFFEDQKMVKRSNMISTDNKKAAANPMTRSGLIFSGAENTMNGEVLSDDNGWLNSYEASLLNLRGTELVVLSACETGSGDVQNGKGVYGLQRAIRVAGAESLIMSMWEVDDKATQELMTYFYDYWIDKKMSKKEAFKEAQLKIREKYKHPYYWGAFIMLGE